MIKEKTILLLTLSFKKCACCGEVKPTTKFSRKKNRGKWGFYSYCNDCKHEKAKKYYLDNTEKCKRQARGRDLKKYGITLEEQEKMMRDQDNKCAIWGKEIYLFGSKKNNTAHVDHDHLTGKVRGLLCQECNTGLGKFRDNPLFLANAIKYLEETKDF